MKNVNLLTPLDKIDELTNLADTSSQHIRINAQTLRALLIDHSVMFTALKDSTSVRVTEPIKRHRELVK